IIVTGADRPQALARARRALRETEIGGLATVLPFARAVLDMPDFTAERAEDFTVHTTWITSDFTDHLASLDQAQPPPGAEVDTEEDATERVVVEVGGKRLEVVLPVGLGIRKRRAAHGAGR